MSLQFDGHAISNQKLKLMSGQTRLSRGGAAGPAVAAPLAQAGGSDARRVTGRLSRLTQSNVPGLRFRRDARSLVESET